MITLTDNQKEMLRSNNVKKNWTFEIYSGNAFIGYIPTANMVDDSFSIKEALSTSETIEIGACEAATLAVQVADISYSLKGKNLKVWLSVEYDGESLTLPMGRFYVDECKNKNGTYFYNITAYDGMSLFDVDVSSWYKGLSFPITLKEMRNSLCKYIGVEQESVTLPCDDISISESISNFSLTGRNVLKAICQLNGCFGHFTREGTLTYVYLDNTSTLTLKEGGEDCYQTSATHEETTSGEFDSVSITPYESSSSDDEDVDYPEDSDALRTLCVQNNFLTYGMDEETLSEIAAIIYKKIINHPYVVHNTPTQGRVWQEVGDAITLEVESYGEMVTFDTFILERTLSGFQAASDTYAAKGTETSDSLSTSSAQEMSVLAKAESIVSARETALREFNSIISSAIGLYEITVTDDDGAVTYYYANASTIKEATLVYTFNSGGFAWGTKDENSEDLPEWIYGISNDGNAILNYLYVNKLTADYISVSSIVGAINESTGEDELLISADKIDISGKTLTLTLTDYAKTSDGEESFSYKLTSSEFTLYAKGAEDEEAKEVLKADKNGLTISGEVNATSGTFTDVDVQSGTIGGLTISNNSISSDNDNFSITNEGVLTATGAKISGEVNATSGTFSNGVTIGDFIITEVDAGSGQPSASSTDIVTALYTSKYMSITKKALKFFDGSSSYMSYSNMDYQGFGSLWRTSNTDGEREQASITQFPYVALDCYAQGGLSINYWASSGNLGSSLQVFLDSDNSFKPTITATGTLLISSDNFNVTNNMVSAEKFVQNDCNVSAPHISDSETTDDYEITVFDCGDLKIICVEYSSAVSANTWKTIDLSNYVGLIYTAQVTGRATNNYSLSSYSLSGGYTVYIDESTVYVGQDGDSSQQGFRLFVIGIV